MCYTAEELEEKINILPPVDYKKVDEILQSEKMRSINWLKSAIEKSKDIFKPLSEFDILDNRLDELSEKMRNSEENQTEELKNLVLTLANKDKIMRKYYRYKLLSKILRGKKGEHYIKKAQIYHEKVRRIRELQKNF